MPPYPHVGFQGVSRFDCPMAFWADWANLVRMLRQRRCVPVPQQAMSGMVGRGFPYGCNKASTYLWERGLQVF